MSKNEGFIKALLDEFNKYESLKNFLNRIEEIGEISIKRTGVSEDNITIKGRHWVTNILDCTTRIAEDIIIYNTSTGLICWKVDKTKYEQ